MEQPAPTRIGAGLRSLGRDARDPRAFAWASGALIAGSALPPLVLERARPSAEPLLSWILTLASTVAWLAAGLLLGQRVSEGRVLATVGSITLLGLAAPVLVSDPAVTLVALVSITGGLVYLWDGGLGSPRPASHSLLRARRARGGAAIALPMWPAVALIEPHPSSLEAIALGGALSASTVLAIFWLVQDGRTSPKRATLVALSVVVQVALTVANRERVGPLLTSLSVAPACAFLAIPRHEDATPSGAFDAIAGHPERLFVGTFAMMSIAGALVLALPISAASGHSIGLVDAIFTAVSAVCVTGLIVLDTPTAFSGFGKVVLLVLIQAGGLGIMTFSTAALRVFGRRMSLRHETAVARLMGAVRGRQLFSTARSILAYTVIAEALGAVLLAYAFTGHGDPFPRAAFRGVFTAVSAFCNAGFALQSDSLVPYQSDPIVVHTVGMLIVLGGLGPAAVAALPTLVFRRHQPVSVQSRLGLITTLILLVSGFVLFLAFEYDASLGDLDLMDRLHNAWFSSVTLRTAGFNSVDMTRIQPATLSFMMVWMFIGGTPGGTAGGIKTTTAAVLVLSVVKAVSGQWELRTFGRRVSERTRSRASVVATLALSTFLVALLAIQLTQSLPTRLAVFEVVSALATVGLSLGATTQLDTIGKLLITLCMFVGRVGGLSVLMFLSERSVTPDIKHPHEDVDVG